MTMCISEVYASLLWLCISLMIIPSSIMTMHLSYDYASLLWLCISLMTMCLYYDYSSLLLLWRIFLLTLVWKWFHTYQYHKYTSSPSWFHWPFPAALFWVANTVAGFFQGVLSQRIVKFNYIFQVDNKVKKQNKVDVKALLESLH